MRTTIHTKLPMIFRSPLLALFTLLAILGTMPSNTAFADEYPEQVAERLQKRFDAMTSLSFSFNQRSQSQIGGRAKTGSGTAYFSKLDNTPKMRWNYSAPDQQVLISDGETFSMYFAELKQLIISPAEALDNDVTYGFFSGRSRIAESFHILPPDEQYMTNQPSGSAEMPNIIKLVPKGQQSQLQSIHLWVDDDSLIRRIELLDLFDTVTVINISKITVDFLGNRRSEARKLFSFTPPAGTEIIRQ